MRLEVAIQPAEDVAGRGPTSSGVTQLPISQATSWIRLIPRIELSVLVLGERPHRPRERLPCQPSFGPRAGSAVASIRLCRRLRSAGGPLERQTRKSPSRGPSGPFPRADRGDPMPRSSRWRSRAGAGSSRRGSPGGVASRRSHAQSQWTEITSPGSMPAMKPAPSRQAWTRSSSGAAKLRAARRPARIGATADDRASRRRPRRHGPSGSGSRRSP